MVRAVWKGNVIAESDATRVVEGNHYFPLDDVNLEYLEPSEKTTVCPWKGVASYYDVWADGGWNRAAAWTYRDPSPAAREIAGHVAFWKGVKVVDDSPRPDGRRRFFGLLR